MDLEGYADGEKNGRRNKKTWGSVETDEAEFDVSLGVYYLDSSVTLP